MRFLIPKCIINVLLLCLFLSGCGSGESKSEPVDVSQPQVVADLSIISHIPSVSQIDVDIDSAIEVKFNRDIDTQDISLVLKKQDTTEIIDGSISFNTDNFVFSPAPLLSNNSKHNVTVSYIDSQNISQDYSWSFSTVSAPSIVVESTTPQHQATDIDINNPIIITLSDEVVISDIDFEIKKLNTINALDGELSLINKDINFIPTTPLDYESEYTVEISASTTSDLNFDSYSFSFKTGAPEQRAAGSFHPPILKYGKTNFLITPIESVKAEELTKVSFGIPFPKDYLSNIKQFRILDQNNDEVAIAVKEVLPWRYINNDKTSIRSVLVQLELEFQANEYGLLIPRELSLEWGVNRTTSDIAIEPARNSWVLVDDEEYPASASIYEPKAYVLFQPNWYGDSVIKTRLLPLGSHTDFSAYDTAFKLFGDTAINHVDPRVIDDNLIPHRKSYAAWLFDRAMTIYQLAFRTGELKYLRAAHRASQFYLQHINEQGYFSLKSSNDMKYSYGESLVAEFILFGDERIPNAVESMIPVWDSFNSDYKLTTNFWTERHSAIQLKGYITAYELTGKMEYQEKSYSTFNHFKKMQDDPEDGVPLTGALMHTAASHGEGGEQFIASPWMSVLLIDAIERFYIQFEEPQVATFVTKMADYFQQENVALYEWKGYQGKDSFFVPYYLAGMDLTDKEHGGIGANDLEHGIDVIKIFSSAYFYSCAKEECDDSYLSTISRLSNTAFTQNIPYWIRAAAPSSALSSYRLAPPRKFNWWFNSTSNNDFLLGSETNLPVYKESAPLITLVQSEITLDSFKPGDEIAFNFQLKNLGTTVAKNVVITASTPIKSPEGLLEVTSINHSGENKAGEIVWYFESLEPNEKTVELSFSVLVKSFPTLQRKSRTIGDILSFAQVNYCDENDLTDVCLPWVNVWNSGEQTYKIQSNWLSISPKAPTTPPNIEIISPVDSEVIDGIQTILAIVEDPDGVFEVDFLLDNKKLATLLEPPYQVDFQFDALSDGPHELVIQARDLFGSEAIKTISVEAKNPDNTAPKVNIISPENNKEYCDAVVVDYEVEDDFSIKTCEISLNDRSITMATCDQFELLESIPLFNAKAYLPLDGGTEIVTSTNQTSLIGQLEGASWNIGNERTSLSFNGDEDYVDFITSKLNISNDITVSFWLNPQAEEGMIMSQDWEYIGNEFGWAISMGENHHEDNNTLSITWSSGTNLSNLNSGNVIQTPPYTISLDQWQHVVVRKKDKQVDIFINGLLITSELLIDGNIAWPFNSNKKFTLAKAMKHPDMYNKNYQGLLDDIVIWNEALTDVEVSQLNSETVNGNVQHMVIKATDNAGNTGESFVDFSFKSCH